MNRYFININKPLIEVFEPIVKEGIKSYVIYKVRVSPINEIVLRRFSDFYSLREKLLERWPGVYIPNIPPKKVVVNI